MLCGRAEHEIQTRIDFALTITHLFGALDELKSAAMTIPTFKVGTERMSKMIDIKNDLRELLDEFNERYRELYVYTVEGVA